MKLLLHSCCGPCSTYPLKVLKEKRDLGMISEEDYQLQRTEIIDKL